MSSTILVETAERNINTKPVEKEEYESETQMPPKTDLVAMLLKESPE